MARRERDGGASGPRRRALIAALVVALVAAPVLAVAHHVPRAPLPARVAVRDASHSVAVVKALAGTHWTAASASALDSGLERVSFFDGARTVAEVAVRADGSAAQIQNFARERVPFGNWVAYEPAVLAGLSALFILMVGVLPVRRLRNLDLAAVLSLVATVILVQHGYVDAGTLAALPGLVYLAARLARRGLGYGPDQADSRPLLDWVTRGWEAEQRVRVLRALVVALALILAMVGVGSPSALDVAYAAMEGATRIVHGVLPYGHLPGDVIHGDTYPILSYALYVPIAWASPVPSTFSSVDGALAVAVLAALASAVALYRSAAGPRQPSRARDVRAETAGLRAAIAWLSSRPC